MLETVVPAGILAYRWKTHAQSPGGILLARRPDGLSASRVGRVWRGIAWSNILQAGCRVLPSCFQDAPAGTRQTTTLAYCPEEA